MNTQKKKYLSLYLLQHSRITAYSELMKKNPKEKEKYIFGINECLKIKEDIENKIKSVDGGILSEILFLKYICGKPLIEISYVLNYSVRHIERLHIKALEKLTI